MKARNETQKPVHNDLYGSQELKRARRLKPIKKEKNQKQSLFQEIDELEDIEMDYKIDQFDEDFYDEEEEENDY
jgi:hypothetical protein